MMNHAQRNLLRALYEMASEDRAADLPSLAGRLGISCTKTIGLLDGLERAGLVDAERVRLTLVGLSIAVAAPALSATGYGLQATG